MSAVERPPESEWETEVERLLELHDELDELAGASSAWAIPIWIALLVVVVITLIRVFSAGLSLQVAMQFGLVLGLGLVGVAVPYVLQRRRMRELRGRIDEMELHLESGDSE